MRSSLVNARLVFIGSSSALTRKFCEGLETRGLVGHLAATLFRAQKASARAKKYGPTRYRGMSYGRKEEMLQKLCELLAQTDWSWGWGKDGRMYQAPHVLYIELPQGQVSFHCAERFDGPEYGKPWDGQKASEARILEFADAVASGQITRETATSLEPGTLLQKKGAKEKTAKGSKSQARRGPSNPKQLLFDWQVS